MESPERKEPIVSAYTCACSRGDADTSPIWHAATCPLSVTAILARDTERREAHAARMAAIERELETRRAARERSERLAASGPRALASRTLRP